MGDTRYRGPDRRNAERGSCLKSPAEHGATRPWGGKGRSDRRLNIVTEAFGFTGQYITRRLLQMGEAVVNLTGHPGRPHAFGDRVPSRPFNFDTPAELAKTLEAARALHNTYWARFPYKRTTFDLAIQNTLALFRAARRPV